MCACDDLWGGFFVFAFSCLLLSFVFRASVDTFRYCFAFSFFPCTEMSDDLFIQRLVGWKYAKMVVGKEKEFSHLYC